MHGSYVGYALNAESLEVGWFSEGDLASLEIWDPGTDVDTMRGYASAGGPGQGMSSRDELMSQVAFDSQEFRRALGRFATGITIITARAPDSAPVGLTCNSFGSLSLDPPLVQWSIATSSRNYAALCAATHFAVHVLDSNQGELCWQFSAKNRDRFASLEIEEGLAGLPLLRRYHARFECETHAQLEAGDHMIIIGRVLRLREQDGDPLLFYRGALSRIAPVC
jgi:3-hydroxy-9,10-secoandrosta-1,3,5(10)-triene-9,17-dione monooxygenase reductase component